MLDLLKRVNCKGLERTNDLDLAYLRRMNKTNYFELKHTTFRTRKNVLFELPTGILVVVRKRNGVIEALTQNDENDVLCKLGGLLQMKIIQIGTGLRDEDERIIVNLIPPCRHFRIGASGGHNYLAKQKVEDTNKWQTLVIHSMSRHHEQELTLSMVRERARLPDEWLPKYTIFDDESRWVLRYRSLDKFKNWALFQIDQLDDPMEIELPVLKMVRT